MESDLSKFKHVLEYFVTHQNYLSSNSSVSVRGYDKYLKSFIENNNFYMTGQGYNDGSIQNQIGEWDNIHSHQICLNIQPNFGNYESKKSYLNWRGTGLNIFCDWENREVKALSIGYAYWWLKPTQYHIINKRTISELNLYEENGNNSLLKEFFDTFVNEINDYDTHKGDYYLKEQEYYRQVEQEKNMEKNRFLIDILVSNYNLILTGAPGTGKTYLAKQIALQFIFGESKEIMTEAEQQQFEEQCKLVQFHPSYDYTDFVEGLRPTKNENDKHIGFERKNGVFKDFCKNALKHSVKFIYCSLAKEISENNRIIKLKGGEDANLISNGRVIKAGEKYSKEYPYTIEYSKIESIFKRYKGAQIDEVSKIKGIIHLQYEIEASYYWAVYDEIRKRVKPFVFIIDEINRGEISKIFGELFFSIDPGYRGTAGEVQTQYQNLIDKNDVFFKGFYVPENVYIIGTMNDIDRSVESMDFAFRRRFAFKEIKAEENVGMLDGLKWKDEAIENKMKPLNAAISSIEGLSSAYHIGASYFLKLINYDGDFDKLWDYHLEGLLREYLRGMQDVEEKIKQLKEAYGYESYSNNGQ